MSFWFNHECLNKTTKELVSIEHSVGDHSRLVARMVNLEDDTELVELVGKSLTCTYESGGEEMEVFSGVISEIEFDASRNRNSSIFTISALSESIRADLVRRNRVFQDPNQTLGDIINKVKQDMPCDVTLGEGDFDSKLPLSVQYEETDYAYIKRIASGFGIPLVIENNGKKLCVGQSSMAAVSIEDREIIGDLYQGFIQPIQLQQSFAFSAGNVGKFQKGLKDFSDSLRRDSKHYLPNTAFEESQERQMEYLNNEDTHSFSMNGGRRRLKTKRTFLHAGQEVSTSDGGTYRVLSTIVTSMGEIDGGDEFEQDHILAGTNKVIPRMERNERLNTQMFLATVTKNEGDQDNYGRIQVRFDWEEEQGSNQNAQCWVDVLTPYAGEPSTKKESFGVQMLPEVGEKVMVRFLDPLDDKPVIIGSLRRQPLHETIDTAKYKTIRTPEGTRIDLIADSGKEIIHVRAGEKEEHHIEIVTEGGKTQITVQCDDSLKLLGKDILIEGETINIHSTSEAVIKSDGKMDVESTGAMSMKSNASLDVAGTSGVNVKSDANMSLQSNAGTEVKSSAIVSVKGSLIQLN